MDEIQFVVCGECGHEQPDMGNNVLCEECGHGPMPTHGDDVFDEIADVAGRDQ